MATTGVPLVLRLISSSVAISRRAAKIVTDIMKTGELDVVQKTGEHDLQTEADRSAQRCIISSLNKNFPNVKVFGEEELDDTLTNPEHIETAFDDDVLKCSCPAELENVTDEDVTVWVDPLDGTKEYTQGLLDHVTILIGVAVQGQAVGGVMYQPYYNFQEGAGASIGRAIWGIVGVGAFGFTPRQPPQGENIITTTRSHNNVTNSEAVEACNPTKVLRVGGAGHKVLLLLEGRCHVYIFASMGTKKWDTCAPEAILRAHGGELTDVYGERLQYHSTVQRMNSGGCLATMCNHQWYTNKMPPSVKSALNPKL